MRISQSSTQEHTHVIKSFLTSSVSGAEGENEVVNHSKKSFIPRMAVNSLQVSAYAFIHSFKSLVKVNFEVTAVQDVNFTLY